MTTLVANTTAASPSASTLCAHCNLPVPKGLIDDQREHQFCCAGCASVYRVLHGAQLGGYYTVRDAVDPKPRAVATTGASYEELDDPAFQAACVDNLPAGQAQTELLLEGMHCAACVWLIERLPRVCPGVIESRANIRTRSAVVRFAPDRVRLSTIARALDRLGYAAHPARGATARHDRAREDRRFLIRVAVAGAISGNVMILAIALYAGAFSGITPMWENTLRAYSMGLGLLSLFWPGRVFFIGALAALRTRTAHLDIPIALALAVGGIWGSFNTLTGGGEIYFDSLSVLVFLLLVGRWVQHRQQRSAADQVALMLTLTPTSALKLNPDATTTRVPIEAIEEGMLVRVEAGACIPTDGLVETGATSLDNAFLTGESRPVPVAVGDAVIAGATNLRSPITVRVTAVGESTRAAKLMAMVASASAAKAPIVQFADRIAARFVLIVITLAALTFAYWTRSVDVRTGIELATALLIVTCPCALGLATPMAMSVAMGRAAKQGVLVKSAAAIESMARPGTMILDKTGTLTQARTRVVETHCPPELLRRAAALETHSNHPLARAITDAVDATGLRPARDIDQTTGAGITGRIDNDPIAIGSPDFIASRTELTGSTLAAIERVLDRALTPVVIVSDQLGQGVLGIGDPLRPDAAGAVMALKTAGWDLRLCSGDHPQIASRIGAEVGIDHAIGGASPEAKAALIDSLRAQGSSRVVMVGDGVNDAAALASADVGIAVHGGAEASLQAADIYLTTPGIVPLVTLTHLATHTMRTIHAGLGFSIVYNTLGATLAITGVITPLIAAVLMPFSSLTVVAISTRRWKAPTSPSTPAQEPTPCP